MQMKLQSARNEASRLILNLRFLRINPLKNHFHFLYKLVQEKRTMLMEQMKLQFMSNEEIY